MPTFPTGKPGFSAEIKISLDILPSIVNTRSSMTLYSTRQAAKKLGIGVSTLSQYISRKKIPAPKTIRIGDLEVHSWSDQDIEHVRQLLPKIANGRKTRYQKLREKQKAQPKNAAPRKTRKTK